MTRLLHVLIILLTTFSQTRNLPGNTVHDFAHTDYINVMISIDLAAGSSNPAAPSCDVSVGISPKERAFTKHLTTIT